MFYLVYSLSSKIREKKEKNPGPHNIMVTVFYYVISSNLLWFNEKS